MGEYADFHRREMQMAIERQDHEWHQLNVRQYGYFRTFWRENSGKVGLVCWLLFLGLVVYCAAICVMP
jgi:hypothetical protein